MESEKVYAVETRNVSPTGDFLWRTHVDSTEREEMEDVFARMASEALAWHEVRLVERTGGKRKIIKKTEICRNKKK